jgi:hypothetical protein
MKTFSIKTLNLKTLVFNTVSIKELSINTLSLKTLIFNTVSIEELSIKTLSILTFNVIQHKDTQQTALCIMTLSITIRKCDTQHKGTQHNDIQCVCHSC